MMKIGKMIDMANEPEKKEAEPAVSVDYSPPKYPWGLCIRLDETQLKKLDLDLADVGVGDTIHLFALAKVTSLSSSEREDAKPSQSVELQITHLAVEDEDAENQMSDDERAERRYKSKDG